LFFRVNPSVDSLAFAPAEFRSLQTAQVSVFSSWRPYSNPDRLISAGMNKVEVLAIAGKPDHEESYYQGGGGRLIRISDWYYIRSWFRRSDDDIEICSRELGKYHFDINSLITDPIPRLPSSSVAQRRA
jgi:hypothetical protein